MGSGEESEIKGHGECEGDGLEERRGLGMMSGERSGLRTR